MRSIGIVSLVRNALLSIIIFSSQPRIGQALASPPRVQAKFISYILDVPGTEGDIFLSPLVFDLDGDGLELISVEKSTTNFDLDVNEFAERVGWVSPDDGILTLDRDQDGKIDNGSELFGDHTPITNGTGTATDGFVALSQLDTNFDGIINSEDQQFSRLRIWQDQDQDGKSDRGEFSSLRSLSITSIKLNPSNSSKIINGNRISLVSTFRRADGSHGTVGDVYFKNNPVNSVFVGDYTLSLRALLLPTIRGYGNVADFHIAMSRDLSLKNMVEDFVKQGFQKAVLNFNKDIEKIIFKWARVEDLDPEIKLWNIDMRKVAVLEAISLKQIKEKIQPASIPYLNKAWDRLALEIGTRLLFLGPGEKVFPKISYSMAKDSLTTTASMSELVKITHNNRPLEKSNRSIYWTTMKKVLRTLGTENGLSITTVDAEIMALMLRNKNEYNSIDKKPVTLANKNKDSWNAKNVFLYFLLITIVYLVLIINTTRWLISFSDSPQKQTVIRTLCLLTAIIIPFLVYPALFRSLIISVNNIKILLDNSF